MKSIMSSQTSQTSHNTRAVWPTQEGPGNQAHLSYKGNSTKRILKKVGNTEVILGHPKSSWGPPGAILGQILP